MNIQRLGRIAHAAVERGGCGGEGAQMGLIDGREVTDAKLRLPTAAAAPARARVEIVTTFGTMAPGLKKFAPRNAAVKATREACSTCQQAARAKCESAMARGKEAATCAQLRLQGLSVERGAVDVAASVARRSAAPRTMETASLRYVSYVRRPN